MGFSLRENFFMDKDILPEFQKYLLATSFLLTNAEFATFLFA
jgi:hypothetical protein